MSKVNMCSNPDCCLPLSKSQIRFKNKFCSSSCAAKYNNKIRGLRSESTKKKISKSLKIVKPKKLHQLICSICQLPFEHRLKITKTCSADCRAKLQSSIRSDYLKDPENRKKYKGRSEPSYMEKSFSEWLIKNGIPNNFYGFLTEIHFYNPNVNKHGWADFVFPKSKLIIELDGTQHRKTVVQDQIRDDYLKSKGWEVFRISYNEYQKASKTNLIKAKLGML